MDAPQDYKTAGIFMLISAALTGVSSFIVVVFYIWACFGAFWLIPLALAGFEMYVAINMVQDNRMEQAKLASIGGLIAAILVCNPIALVLEILSLIWLRKPEVTGWLDLVF